jgi:8-oxo-dGTP pyrophosphatase MutT (NUDIX family)
VAAEETNKALVREFFEEAWIKGNVATVDEYMAADHVEYPRPSTLSPGAEGLKQMISTYRTAFPDLKMTLDDIARDALRAEGDGVRCWCSGPLL